MRKVFVTLDLQREITRLQGMLDRERNARVNLLSVLRRARMFIANNGAFRSKEDMLREIEAADRSSTQR